MKVSVVIPNFNGASLLKKTLPKILSAVGEKEVIVVDDASTDDSLTILKKYFPKVKVMVRTKNEGFASSVNDGVENTSGELVFLLNSDVIPEKNFLAYLIPHFADPKVFAVGCLQYSREWKGQKIHGRGIGKFSQGFLVHAPGGTSKKNTLWVFGGAGIFRRSIWEKFGGLDTLYNPFYWEDIDLSYRALKAGYKLFFEPKSVVYHDQEQGAIRANYAKNQVNTIAYRNQILFVWLNITDMSLLIEHLIYLPYHLIKSLIKLDFSFPKAFLVAIFKIPQVLSHRLRNQKLSIISDKMVLQDFIA